VRKSLLGRPWRVYGMHDSCRARTISFNGKGPRSTLVQALRWALLKQDALPHLTYYVEHVITGERIPVRGLPL
jgi:hypothetical protein